MPESRAVALPERLNSRSYTGSAEFVQVVAGGTGVQAGTFNITSYVLPAAMNTSFCTRGMPGSGLPSSAISEKPDGGTVAAPVCDPAIAGTCMREPAFTRRTSTLPVTPGAGDTRNSEPEILVLSNATPLMR